MYDALVPLVPGRLGVRRGDLLASVVDDVDALVDDQLRVRQPCGPPALVGVGAAVLTGLVIPRRRTGRCRGCPGRRGRLLIARAGANRAEPAFVRAPRGAVEPGGGDPSRRPTAGPVAGHADRSRRARPRRLSDSHAPRAALRGRWPRGGPSSCSAAASARSRWPRGSPREPPAPPCSPCWCCCRWPWPTRSCRSWTRGRCRSGPGPRADGSTASSAPCTCGRGPRPVPHRRSRPVGSTLEVHDVSAGWGEPDALRGVSPRPPARSSRRGHRPLRLGQVDPRRAADAVHRPARGVGHSSTARTCGGYALDDVRRGSAWSTTTPTCSRSNVAENIRLARPDADDADVAAALRAAHLGPWLDALPERADHDGRRGQRAGLGRRTGPDRHRPRLAGRPAHPRAGRADRPTRHSDRPRRHRRPARGEPRGEASSGSPTEPSDSPRWTA